jgi:hypothetical protein
MDSQQASSFIEYFRPHVQNNSRLSRPRNSGGFVLDEDISTDMSQSVKLYYASEHGKYSALVMIAKIDHSMSIATVYGKFDFSLLGGSFNIPPLNENSMAVGAPMEMDTSIMQMTAYFGDSEGLAFSRIPNGPPFCEFCNYSLMTFDVSNGTIPLKPKGWKSGNPIPYVLNIENMKPLSLTELSNTRTWCKDVANVSNVPTNRSTTDNSSNNSSTWIMVIIAFFILFMLVSVAIKK